MTTPILGAGAAPAGAAIAGYGAPATIDGPGDDLLPAGRGVSGTCAYVDPGTRDYAFDATGDLVGATSAQQLVWLALAGFTAGPTMLTEQAIRVYELELRAALQPLVQRQVIAIRRIDIQRASVTPTRLATRITWLDTLSGHEQTTAIV